MKYTETEIRLVLPVCNNEKRSEHVTIHVTPSRKKFVSDLAAELNLSVNETYQLLLDQGTESLCTKGIEKDSRPDEIRP